MLNEFKRLNEQIEKFVEQGRFKQSGVWFTDGINPQGEYVIEECDRYKFPNIIAIQRADGFHFLKTFKKELDAPVEQEIVLVKEFKIRREVAQQILDLY